MSRSATNISTVFVVRTLDTRGRTLERWPDTPHRKAAKDIAIAVAYRKNDGAESVIVERIRTNEPPHLIELFGAIEPVEMYGYSVDTDGYKIRK